LTLDLVDEDEDENEDDENSEVIIFKRSEFEQKLHHHLTAPIPHQLPQPLQ
jgi:hypothetical protein